MADSRLDLLRDLALRGRTHGKPSAVVIAHDDDFCRPSQIHRFNRAIASSALAVKPLLIVKGSTYSQYQDYLEQMAEAERGFFIVTFVTLVHADQEGLTAIGGKMQKAMDALRPPVQTCTGGRVEVYAQCYGHLTTSTEHLARQLHQISITPTTLEVPRTCNIPLSTIDGTIGFAHSALEPQLLLDPRVQVYLAKSAQEQQRLIDQEVRKLRGDMGLLR